MEFVCVAVAVFSLLSVGQAAPVSDCESLLRPLKIPTRDPLLGKWVFIAVGDNTSGSKAKMLLETMWVNLTAAEEPDKLIGYINQKMFGFCFSVKSVTTLRNNTLSTGRPHPMTAVLLSTSCPDCLVTYSNNHFGNSTYTALQLFSRRNSVTDAELQEFKKQVECLDLQALTILDPKKGFCPDPSESPEMPTIDLTKNAPRDNLQVLYKIF